MTGMPGRDRADLEEGLRQSAAGETVDLGSFEQYADDEGCCCSPRVRFLDCPVHVEQGTPPESVADSDTAFELGWVAGWDEAMREVQGWLSEVQANAWRLGHDAGRDYQGDGWNCDVHDPELDNPFR